MRKFQIGIVLFALAVLFSRRASAMGASAGILVGNGFKDGYNVGFGARGGFTLPLGVYIGGTFVYHLGKSESTPGGDLTTHLFYLGPEGGYELSAGPLTVRPYLGLGYASFSASVPQSCAAGICGGGATLTDGKLSVWPGATALFPVGKLFIGGDLRYVVLLDTTDANAFSIFLTGGMNF